MKRHLALPFFFLLGSICPRADEPTLSPPRLDRLDQQGYFTPAFKTAVRELVQMRQAIAQSRLDEKKLTASLPDLQRQCDQELAEAARLRQELQLYTHPEVADFAALQAALKNPSTPVERRIALAQAFVWSYPNDPHLAAAEEELVKIQKEQAAQRQIINNTAAAQSALALELMRRAKARELSLREWQDFLRDKSQEELLALLGRPQIQGADYWIYSGTWTWNPATKSRSGLRVDFNGTRVLNIVPVSP
jgi:hypothetical protein